MSRSTAVGTFSGSRTSDSSHSGNLRFLASFSTNTIAIGSDWRFKPAGVHEVQRRFDEVLKATGHHGAIQWLNDSHVFRLFVGSHDGLDFLLGTLNRITRDIQREEGADSVRRDEEDSDDSFSEDSDSEFHSDLLERITDWQPREEDQSKFQKIKSDDTFYPKAIKCHPHKAIWVYHGMNLDQALADIEVSQLASITMCQIEKVFSESKVYIGSSDEASIDIVRAKLDTIVKYKEFQSKSIRHVLYNENIDKIRFAIKFFKDMKKKHFENTLMESPEIYNPLQRGLTIRACPFSYVKSDYVIYKPDKHVAAVPANQILAGTAASRVWAGFEFDKRGEQNPERHFIDGYDAEIKRLESSPNAEEETNQVKAPLSPTQKPDIEAWLPHVPTGLRATDDPIARLNTPIVEQQSVARATPPTTDWFISQPDQSSSSYVTAVSALNAGVADTSAPSGLEAKPSILETTKDLVGLDNLNDLDASHDTTESVWDLSMLDNSGSSWTPNAVARAFTPTTDEVFEPSAKNNEPSPNDLLIDFVDAPEMNSPADGQVQQPQIQTLTEVDTRVYHQTMRQKAPKPGLSQSLRVEDPQAAFLKKIEVVFASIMTPVRGFSGSVAVQLDFGRIVLGNLPVRIVSTPEREKPHSEEVIDNHIYPPHNARPGDGPELYFGNIVSTIEADTTFLRGLKDKQENRLWSKNVADWKVVYEFQCQDQRTGYLFDVEVDAEANKTSIKSVERKFGEIYIHATMRNWDCRISVTGLDDEGQLRNMDASYDEFARAIHDSLYIPPGQTKPNHAVEIPDHLSFFTIFSLKIRKTKSYLGPNNQTKLNITEVDRSAGHELTVKEKGIVVYIFREEEKIMDGVETCWQEVSVSSTVMDEMLTENLTLELGEETKWTVPNVVSKKVTESLIRPACHMLRQMDGVGFYNDNGLSTKVKGGGGAASMMVRLA